MNRKSVIRPALILVTIAVIGDALFATDRTRDRDSSDQWLIPVGGGVGRVFKIGSQPVNVSVQGFYNTAKPSDGSDWSTRVQFQFLFPRKKS